MKNPMKHDIPYNYVVRNIGVAKDPAYEAYIPTLNGYVYGDSMQELEEGIVCSIEAAIASYKRKGLRIPTPDRDVKRSGKIVLRIPPSLHERLAIAAAAHGKSINSYIVEKVAMA